MKKQLIIGLKMVVIMTLLLGVVYPLLITGFAQVFFSSKANGSLVEENGIMRGSELIGQKMDKPAYFNSRPSAVDYNTMPSGASNLNLTSKVLHKTVEDRKRAFVEKNKLSQTEQLPAEMLFASASGIDPHISPEAALIQVERISEIRGFTEKQKQSLLQLVDKMIEKPQFDILGCSRINVFLLNLELDKLK